MAVSPEQNKTSTVVKQFVVDFSSETYKPLMEHEVNGLDYRYVYSDKARLSVVVQGIENGSASSQFSSAVSIHLRTRGGAIRLRPRPQSAKPPTPTTPARLLTPTTTWAAS